MTRQRITVIVGTRPEAIKLAPVIMNISRRPGVEQTVVLTGQHRELLHTALRTFSLTGDVDLALMEENQTLADLTARALAALDQLYRSTSPDWIVVQGDTTTAFCGALAAFYRGLRVAHVEAGLRTDDPGNPFPEEINRRFIGQLATLHFAPTPRARANLLREGVAADRVFVTGNTGIDAVLEIAKRRGPLPLKVQQALARGTRLLLVTAHRRESFGAPLESICAALRSLVERNPDVCVVYSVHPNPKVTRPVRRSLGNLDRVILLDAVGYEPFVNLMKASYLILTDSGGIQEEAPSLRKPVLVLRTATERVEALEVGTAVLVGTDHDRIVAATELLLKDTTVYRQMSSVANPYGDGHAASRIADVLLGSHRDVALHRFTSEPPLAFPADSGTLSRPVAVQP